MRLTFLAWTAAVLCIVGGCDHHNLTCNNCRVHGRGGGAPGPAYVGQVPGGAELGDPGPPTATYGYPYYTVRAPRDFLMANPPSIGP